MNLTKDEFEKLIFSTDDTLDINLRALKPIDRNNDNYKMKEWQKPDD